MLESGGDMLFSAHKSWLWGGLFYLYLKIVPVMGVFFKNYPHYFGKMLVFTLNCS